MSRLVSSVRIVVLLFTFTFRLYPVWKYRSLEKKKDANCRHSYEMLILMLIRVVISLPSSMLPVACIELVIGQL